MSQTKEQLQQREKELTDRLDAIRKDIGRGLDPNSEEQAIELENMEVLQEIARVAEEELGQIQQQLADLR